VVRKETARLEKVKESGIEVNAEGTKYTLIFREQNAGQHQKLKYFEVTVTEFHAGRN